jgi:hypothetical protein
MKELPSLYAAGRGQAPQVEREGQGVGFALRAEVALNPPPAPPFRPLVPT